MSPERNEPCPCGSGKKYKKCCGLSEAVHKAPPSPLVLNRAVAYVGETGRKREAFCRSYTELKKTTLLAVAAKLHEESEAAGKPISCGRGCFHCCKMFVVASLQECEAIAYHLYHNEKAMQVFLRNFPRWNDRILKIQGTFASMNTLHAKMTAGQASEAEVAQFDLDCDAYAAADIPCPFLLEGACSIYEVRPYVCARIVSVTPADWCRSGHPRQKEAMHLKAQMQFENDMPYFELPGGECVYSSLPFLVWRILNEGYDALRSVPGMSTIKDKAYNDPEVQEALRDLGVETP
jgi:hypothetical protein